MHQLERGTAACERLDHSQWRKLDLAVRSSRSYSDNESDGVSFIGRHRALLPSRLKSQSEVLTKPGQLIGLILAHQ